MQTKSTSTEREAKHANAIPDDQFVFSSAVKELIAPEEAAEIANKHFKIAKWDFPTGELHTVCTVHKTQRGPRIVVVTEADRSSTMLLTATEIVPHVFKYVELQAKKGGEGVSPKEGFPVGRVVKSRGVHLTISVEDIAIGLFRHLAGDWGDVNAEDWLENNFSLDHSLRVLSAYRDVNGQKFYVLTEADRSSTTVLLPDEY